MATATPTTDQQSAASRRKYLPAAGWHRALPIYDPYARLLGWDAVRRVILDQMDLAPGQRVLDIGCATGTLLVDLEQRHPDITAVGLDPDPAALARAARKARDAAATVRFSRGFSNQLPFAGRSFDRISITGMFSLLPRAEREATLHEIHRVLCPGGSLHLLDLVKTPFGSSLWTRVFAKGIWPRGETVRVFGEAELVALMTRVGFAGARKVGQHAFWLWPVAAYRADRPV